MPEFATLGLMMLTLLSGAAVGLAAMQKRRASMMGAASALAISGISTCIVVFDVQPLAMRWAEAGWAGFPPFAIAVYGLGSAMAWRYSRSAGSLRAAIACLIGANAMGYAMFANTMNQMKEVIAHADPADQAIIWQGSLGEAVRIIEIGGLVSLLTALVLLVSLGSPRQPVTLGESTGARGLA